MTRAPKRDGNDRFDELPGALHVVLDPTLDALDALDRVIDACVRFTSATEAGIVLADRAGALHVVASTSERSSEVEEAQLGTAEGSCIDCFRTGKTIDVPDATTHRCGRCLGGRCVSVISLSFCVFASHDRGHGDGDVALIQVLADAASAPLARQRAEEGGARTFDEQVAGALEARDALEQAKGALAYRRGIRMEMRIRDCGTSLTTSSTAERTSPTSPEDPQLQLRFALGPSIERRVCRGCSPKVA
ncbi:GAF domain-containing protein [Curtobacterium sp. ISL-83]|uniref:GAF domain-containing protein n=1 Tax=Curtobacterium sp. ISL-83 TaxID=2819145 RepID=UPI001BE80CF2|nr:GAF domain-containing protein [Curtobacterium sp. ISL-83]MBT2504155.1 hypothetical protein [Curtobacterium sp. ISL-83]